MKCFDPAVQAVADQKKAIEALTDCGAECKEVGGKKFKCATFTMTNQAGWTKEKCWEDTKCIAGKEQAIPNSKEKLNYICFSVKQKAIDAFKKSSIDTMTDCGTGCKEVKGVKHKCATITITGTENKTYKKEKC